MSNPPIHSPDHPNNAQFVEFARREMGSATAFEDLSRGCGRPSIIWRLTGFDGSHAWLKHHEMPMLFDRELTGLEQFVPALGEQTWWSSPTIIAKDSDVKVLLMTEVEGELLDTTAVTPEEQTTMFRLAGRFASKLHDTRLAVPDGQTNGLARLRDQLNHYLNAGKDSVDSKTVAWATELIDEACSTGPADRVPCHMDYSPRNWLIHNTSDGIKFGIIDWERCRWDIWLNDGQRMAYDEWHQHPHLRDAYFEGYGRQPNAAEELKLNALCLVGAIASIPWAINHNDPKFVALSREAITRIRTKVGRIL